MNAASPPLIFRPRFRSTALLLCLAAALLPLPGHATAQLLLSRDQRVEAREYAGVVELTIHPGFDDARVTVMIDGSTIAEGLMAPHRILVDLGPRPIQHRITVTAWTPNRKKRVQWHETINRGMLPLSVKLRPVDMTTGVFEAETTAPKDDPIVGVELWDAGTKLAVATEAPYRITVPAEVLASGFVQVTARTRSGEEAADFWSAGGSIHVESLQVREVPIYVSVVDRNGNTRDDVDRSLFRIVDNKTEGRIIEFGKAFDQPISIALLLDASASMTYAIDDATRAARSFVERTLRNGDRCAVYAVRNVPRRQQALTDDRELIRKAFDGIRPAGRTALWDSIITALRELKGEKNRRAVVVLTDGSDTDSLASFEELDREILVAGVPIYFIVYEGSDVASPKEIDRLRYVAGQTGGFVALATQQSLLAKYREIEKDLRAQFAIRYQVTDLSKSNQWRPVRVYIASPKLTARTIKGYFAP
ncbi:MAG TPA: VWA domain-containing protein [Thermoanaerobaculia bacterium]|nr:VWA domain-containing protein [Thermoanaerobaculia bacterium]